MARKYRSPFFKKSVSKTTHYIERTGEAVVGVGLIFGILKLLQNFARKRKAVSHEL
jgi:hypothetical protein